MELTNELTRETMKKMADCFPEGLDAADYLEIAKSFLIANILCVAKEGREYDIAVVIAGDILWRVERQVDEQSNETI